MKFLDFNSPYARLGMFMSLFALFLSNSFTFSYGHSAREADSIDRLLERGERPFRYSFGGEHPQFGDFLDLSEVHPADVPNFRDMGSDDFIYGSESPCFTVTIDPSVEGHDEDYRLDLFGGQTVVEAKQFEEALATKMAESFVEEAWARSPKCFKGSFVVSFDVEADGSLGSNMLVHYINGRSAQAGIAVLDVVRGMDLEGHRWHDGSEAAGEVRIPVSFRLNK